MHLFILLTTSYAAFPRLVDPTLVTCAHLSLRVNGTLVQILVTCPFATDCRRTDITQKNRNCLFTHRVQTCFCVPMTPVYLSHRQVTFMLTIRIIRYVTWWKLTSKRVVGTLSQLPGKHLACVSRDVQFPTKPLLATAWQYSLGSSYNAQLSVHLWEPYFKKEFIPLLIHSCIPATIVFRTLTVIQPVSY